MPCPLPISVSIQITFPGIYRSIFTFRQHQSFYQNISRSLSPEYRLHWLAMQTNTQCLEFSLPLPEITTLPWDLVVPTSGAEKNLLWFAYVDGGFCHIFTKQIFNMSGKEKIAVPTR